MLVKNKSFQLAASELLAMAVLDVFPQAKILESYITPLGFGLDFIANHPVDDTAFSLIDERMRILIKQDLSFERVDMMRENAVSLFKHQGQSLIAERIAKDLRNIIPLTRINEYYGYNSLSESLNSKGIGEGKLLNFSSKEDLQRKLGSPTVTSFEGVLCKDSKSARQFFKKYKEQKRQDHRVLGSEMELFFQPTHALPGDYTWLPRGESIKNEWMSLWKILHKQQAYDFISSSKWFEKPQAKQKNTRIFPTLTIDSKEIQYLSDYSGWVEDLFKLSLSRKLPLRLAEISKSLTISDSRKNLGLLTADVYTADNAYCLCEEEQAATELISSLQFLIKSINMFAVEHRWYLIVHVSQAADHQRAKDLAFEMLVKALQVAGIEYTLEYDEKNDSVPRVQARIIDSLEREWDSASLRVSFYETKGTLLGKERKRADRRLFLIKRSLFGSLERFIALLLERHAELLPSFIEKIFGEVHAKDSFHANQGTKVE